MSAPTNAPVLAWVVPKASYSVVDKDGTASVARALFDDAQRLAGTFDDMWPEDAPHTVQQLARVVRVVAVDDAMRERAYEAAAQSATGHPWSALIGTVAEQPLRNNVDAILAAALTPPEPSGTGCDYWQPINPGGIAKPCNCGRNCDGLQSITPTPGASPEETDRE